MTSPSTPASAINRFAPPPMTRTGPAWSPAQRNPAGRSWPDFARMNQWAGPPTRSELYGASGTRCSGVTPTSKRLHQAVRELGHVAGAHGQHDIAWFRRRDDGFHGVVEGGHGARVRMARALDGRDDVRRRHRSRGCLAPAG